MKLLAILSLDTLLGIGLVTSNQNYSVCDEGREVGQKEAVSIWRSYEEDCKGATNVGTCVCSAAWGFEDDCEEMMNEYNHIGKGFSTKTFKACFEEGVEQVVLERETHCFNRTGNCQSLAVAAGERLGKKMHQSQMT